MADSIAPLIAPQALKAFRAEASAETAPLMIDVPGTSEYASGHVAGTEHIPLSQLARTLKQFPRERLVVTYCMMHHRGESRGGCGAALLREHGFDARARDGGLPV